MRESATRPYYKNLIDDLPAARVGTLNINVSALAELSLHSCIPGVPKLNHNFFPTLLYALNFVLLFHVIFGLAGKKMKNSNTKSKCFLIL